jgi:hypothetical protein
MNVTKEEVATYSLAVYIFLAALSALLTLTEKLVIKARGSSPAWLSWCAKWSGVLAADVHKVVAAAAPPPTEPPETPKVSATKRSNLFAFLLVGGLAGASALSATACTQQQAIDTLQLASDVAACADQFISQPEPSIGDIACGFKVTQEFVNLIRQRKMQHAAEARAAAKAMCESRP